MPAELCSSDSPFEFTPAHRAGSNKISFAVAAVYDRRHAEYQDKMDAP
jgi:hypothetical protein